MYNLPKNHWWWTENQLLIKCPKCNEVIIIDAESVDINNNGLLWPSVRCITQGCDFHELLILSQSEVVSAS